MKKFFKVLGYMLLVVVLLVPLLLVGARYLTPVIVEKGLEKEFSRAGLDSDVEIDIHKFSPFGIDIPEISVDFGDEEVMLSGIRVDVESLFRESHELKLHVEKIGLTLSESFLDYLEYAGMKVEDLEMLRGRELTVNLYGPAAVVDDSDIYMDFDDLIVTFIDPLGVKDKIELDSLRATMNTNGSELMVTPFDITLNDIGKIHFDEGVYTPDFSTYKLGQVRSESMFVLPDLKLSNLEVKVSDDVVEINSDTVLADLSVLGDQTLFDSVEAEELDVDVRNDGRLDVDTTIYFKGDGKLLDGFVMEIDANVQDGRLEITDGSIKHSQFKATLPFKLALENSIADVEIAGSKRFELDLSKPFEETIEEMLYFVLMKLASSIFGL